MKETNIEEAKKKLEKASKLLDAEKNSLNTFLANVGSNLGVVSQILILFRIFDAAELETP